MANLQKTYEEVNPETETTPIKSILKKSENMDMSRNKIKKNSHVNFAYEFEKNPQNPCRKKPKEPEIMLKLEVMLKSEVMLKPDVMLNPEVGSNQK